MSKGGGSSNQTTTTQVKLPDWANPTAIDILKQGREAYGAKGGKLVGTPYESFGNRITGFTPDQIAAMNMIRNRAKNGSLTMNSANASLQDTLSGKFLNADSNPYLKGAVESGLSAAQSTLGNMLGGASGATTNSGVQQYIAKQLGDVATNQYAQNYNNERQRQMQAMMFAPTMANADYQDANALMGVGDAYRTYNQDLLNQDYEDFYNRQNWDWDQLSKLGTVLGQATGGASSTNATGPNPYKANPLAGGIGGAAAGYGLAATLGLSNPLGWGLTGLGAIAGLLG